MSDISGAEAQLAFFKELLPCRTGGNVSEFICIMNNHHGIRCHG